MVGPGNVPTSLASAPPLLNPQMSCAGMFVSDVILKLGLALMRSTKYFCVGYWLKNWKQSEPATKRPLNWPRPSNGRLKLFGLGALLGHICGRAPKFKPGSVSTSRAGNSGGMGIGSTNTWAGCGLLPRSQLERENEDDDSVWPRAWVKPTLGIRMPAPVISPIFIRSRRVNPSLTSSSLLLSACWTSLSFLLFLFEKCAMRVPPF